MTEPVIIAITTLLGGGAFGGIVAAFFSRRKTAAEADLTVGGAWEKFVLQQERMLESFKRESNQLTGELRAANRRINVLERQLNEMRFWQAQILTRSEMVDAILRAHNLDPPEAIPPPVLREPHTRADDFEREEDRQEARQKDRREDRLA